MTNRTFAGLIASFLLYGDNCKNPSQDMRTERDMAFETRRQIRCNPVDNVSGSARLFRGCIFFRLSITYILFHCECLPVERSRIQRVSSRFLPANDKVRPATTDRASNKVS